MFDALVNGRIDTRGLEFDVRFADIEELNRGVLESKSRRAGGPDISKISYAVLPLITGRYELLDSGSAMGFGNGPLLVARAGFKISNGACVHAETGAKAEIKVAVPGVHTTANLLLQRLFPELTNREPALFSEIAAAVSRGEYDAGVLIHEGRFTYPEHGLELVADLGVEWARATATEIAPAGLPLPLGAIVASRELPPGVRSTVEELIRESVLYAMRNPEVSRYFVKSHAQELSSEVIESHIRLFVNDYSLSPGEKGKAAVRELTGVALI